MSRLKEIREGLGLKQTDVERATGIRVTEQSNLENSHYLPCPATGERLSVYYNTPLYGLLDEEENAFVDHIAASRKMDARPKKKRARKGTRRMTLDLPVELASRFEAGRKLLGLTQVEFVGYLMDEKKAAPVVAHRDGKAKNNSMGSITPNGGGCQDAG